VYIRCINSDIFITTYENSAENDNYEESDIFTVTCKGFLLLYLVCITYYVCSIADHIPTAAVWLLFAQLNELIYTLRLRFASKMFIMWKTYFTSPQHIV